MDKPERYPGLTSVRNFRDLGGYEGLDGRKVRWRTIFRSGMLAHLDKADADQLNDWRIAHVLDFRSQSEKNRDGIIECHDWKPRYLPVPIGGNAAAWLKQLYERLAHEDFPRGEMEKIFQKAYRDYPTVHANDLGQFISRLAEKAPDEAFLFNCTAGKDRTGIGAALLLSVLGIEREMIFEDYMLTNQYADIELRSEQSAAWLQENYGRKIDPETLLPLFGVTREFLEATFQVMDDQAGGALEYLKTSCGVSENTIRNVRNLYLAG